MIRPALRNKRGPHVNADKRIIPRVNDRYKGLKNELLSTHLLSQETHPIEQASLSSTQHLPSLEFLNLPSRKMHVLGVLLVAFFASEAIALPLAGNVVPVSRFVAWKIRHYADVI